MRFSRRAEGVKESRIVFKRGREDTRTNFHVSNDGDDAGYDDGEDDDDSDDNNDDS